MAIYSKYLLIDTLREKLSPTHDNYLENSDQIQLDQHFSIGSEVQGRIKLSDILLIFSTYFILSHYESTVQCILACHRDVRLRDTFLLHYLIRYEKRFSLCELSH